MPVTKEDVDVVVKVDTSLKKAWDESLKQLNEAFKKGAAVWHRKWEVVSAIVDHAPPMYLAGGHSTDVEFYDKVLGETRGVAVRNMRIAKLSSPSEVEAFGASKLDIAIAYVEAREKKSIEARGDVDFARLRIQFTLSGAKVTRSMSTVSVAELREALSQLAVRPKKKVSPQMQLVLAAVKRSGVEGVKATAVGGALNLRVPMSGVAALARELTDFDPTKS